jgi:hypothetical protein
LQDQQTVSEAGLLKTLRERRQTHRR